MGKRLYKQVIRELNENGFVKTLTVISQNENIGKKIIDKMNQYVYEEISIDAVMYYGASEPVLLWDSRED